MPQRIQRRRTKGASKAFIRALQESRVSKPVALHLDHDRNGHIEREETREQFQSDPFELKLIADEIMRICLPQIRRNYQITDLVKQADGQYVATFTRLQFNSICVHCHQPFNGKEKGSKLCPDCFLAGHRGVTCDEYCK